MPSGGAGASAGGGASSAIVAREVSKTYETRDGNVEALRRVSVSVRPGEFVALVGPSGCGKSTLLQICSGLLDASEGEIHVGGEPARAGRRDVGVMFQEAVLLPWRTVLDNVLLPTELFKIDRKQATEDARNLLEMVGLSGFEEKHPWELSGGMQQRATLARLLVSDPQILLMDEPFSALDEFTRERLNVELARIHESLGKTVVYVTHKIEEAVFLADRVVVMKPHPGEVLEVVDVDLPRPRDREMLQTPELVSRSIEIRQMLVTRGGA